LTTAQAGTATPTTAATITGVRRYHSTTVTYDLTINDLHTYYVEAGTTPVLVHNCGNGLTRTAQKAQALQDAGVPAYSEPLEVRQVPATTPGGRQIMDGSHQPVYFAEEDYLTASDNLVTFQDHHTGHQFGAPGGVGDQGPHLHVRPFDNPRSGQLPGVQEHYYYDPKLD